MNLGIKTKTLLPLLLILFIAMVGLAAFNYFSQVALLNSEAEETLQQTINSAQSLITDRLQQYQQLATLTSLMPTIADAFGKGDRKKLMAEFSPGFGLLKKNFQVTGQQFHTPPASSFLRVQEPEKFGDDLSTFRHTVLATNEKQTGVSGIEVGRTGLQLRGIMPVFSKGKHIGSVEFGGDLIPAIDETKNVFSVETGALIAVDVMSVAWPDWQKTIKPIGNYIPLYATNPQITEGLVTPARVAAAKVKAGGKMYMDTGFYAGRNYYIAASPLKDFSGKEIGFLYILKDQTELLNQIRRVLIVNIVMYASILLAISLAINFSLNRTVINPVLNLTKAADEVSMGKLSEKIEVATNDEISALAKSIDRMRASMNKLLE